MFAVVAAMTACLLILSGCGEDKESMQSFAEGIVDVMSELQSNPEVKAAGKEGLRLHELRLH
ncbi:MAG: hypothetical protein L6427_09800 [Actinomycetia bacterium]|nr:hypothetical protein [Actinomycetes bacterium]